MFSNSQVKQDIADAMTRVLASYPDVPLDFEILWRCIVSEDDYGEIIKKADQYLELPLIQKHYALVFETQETLSQYVHTVYRGRNKSKHLVFNTNMSSEEITNIWSSQERWGLLTYPDISKLEVPYQLHTNLSISAIDHLLDNLELYPDFSTEKLFNYGNSLLHYIIKLDNVRLFEKYIRNFNFNPEFKNQNNETPMDIALSNNCSRALIEKIIETTMQHKKSEYQLQINNLKKKNEYLLDSNSRLNQSIQDNILKNRQNICTNILYSFGIGMISSGLTLAYFGFLNGC